MILYPTHHVQNKKITAKRTTQLITLKQTKQTQFF